VKRIGAVLAGVLVTVLVVPEVAGAARAGAPDRSFSGNGHVITDMGGEDGVGSVAIDSEHRIVAIGSSARRSNGVDSARFALARYKPNGRLDRDFSGNGKAYASLGQLTFAGSGAIDGRGRIVVAGGSCSDAGFPDDCEFALARFKPNGKLDPSFGSGGKVTTDFPGGARATSLALFHGKIVVAGVAGDDVALARYNRDGTLDSAFGMGGTATTDVGAGEYSANSMALDAHGRIVVASGGGAFVISRFKPGGRLDPSFGSHGTVTTNFDDYDAAESVVVGKRGRIVAAGWAEQGSGGNRRYRFALARYRGSGKLDRSFSRNGKVKTTFSPFRDQATAVTIDRRGRVVAAGFASGFDLAIARYDPDGGIDRSFGDHGRVRDPIDTIAIPHSVAIDSRDRIVAAGDIHDGFGLARYIGYRHG
jgi:uncharacterized delta-60 repeat protein